MRRILKLQTLARSIQMEGELISSLSGSCTHSGIGSE